MPLYQRRKREREKAELLARGESIPMTEDFDRQSTTRLLHALLDNAPQYLGDTFTAPKLVFAAMVRAELLREWGEINLWRDDQTPMDDFTTFVLNDATSGQMLDVIEAFFPALDKAQIGVYRSYEEPSEARAFRERVNQILDEHDIAYQLVGREMIPRDSMVMHADIVGPALSLLRGHSALNKVEIAFQNALRELKPGEDPANAITDAGTALQEMLVALGAEGNRLGPLLASARGKGLLGPHDSKLAQGVEKIGEWVSADRSTRGDSHSVTDATRDDAWLAVHVVGALILRLEKRF